MTTAIAEKMDFEQAAAAIKSGDPKAIQPFLHRATRLADHQGEYALVWKILFDAFHKAKQSNFLQKMEAARAVAEHAYSGGFLVGVAAQSWQESFAAAKNVDWKMHAIRAASGKGALRNVALLAWEQLVTNISPDAHASLAGKMLDGSDREEEIFRNSNRSERKLREFVAEKLVSVLPNLTHDRRVYAWVAANFAAPHSIAEQSAMQIWFKDIHPNAINEKIRAILSLAEQGDNGKAALNRQVAQKWSETIDQIRNPEGRQQEIDKALRINDTGWRNVAKAIRLAAQVKQAQSDALGTQLGAFLTRFAKQATR